MSEWIRHGECNQCGDCCCQATNCISMQVAIEDEAYGRIRFGEPKRWHHGIPMFMIRGPITLPCPQLQGDRCGMQEEKPQYCRDTPCQPEDIELLPRCSYWFVHHETGEVKGTPSEAR